MIWENIKMAMLSIKGAKMRSALTMLGLIIGIAAVVAINAIGAGVKQQITQQIAGLGTNVITVTSGQVISSKNGHGTPNPAASLGSSTLTQSDVTQIEKVKQITHVAPVMLMSGVAAHGSTTADGALLIATTPGFNQIRDTKLTKGRFLDVADTNLNVAVLGSKVKEQLFGSTNAINQTVTIRTGQFKIIGILESTDTGASFGGPNFDNAIYLPIEAAKTISGGNLQILRILAQADSSQSVQPAVDNIKQTLKKSHGGQEDYSVLTQSDLIATISTILDLLASFIAAIASIALVVGGIGIMNIMLVSVTERTREIGIRKALGATRGNLLFQFLIEALTLSVMGGVLGMAAAVGLAKLAGHLVSITPVFTLQSFVTAAGISAAIGIIFGIAPAIKAARKHPIEALRYE
jgi:putative ABC transport system permease protein